MFAKKKSLFLVVGLLFFVLLLILSLVSFPAQLPASEKLSSSPWYLAQRHPLLRSLAGASVTTAATGEIAAINESAAHQSSNTQSSNNQSSSR